MKKYYVNVGDKKIQVAIDETTFGGSVLQTAVAPTVAVAPVAVATQTPAPSQNVGSGKPILAPMPGTVVKLKASNGSKVNVDQAIVVLEAMKMENEIVTDTAGVINFCVAEGAKVNSGDTIATIS